MSDQQILTQGVVLAAGFGTRMRPLTLTRPKPLIEVAGRSLLDRTLDVLHAGGVKRVVVNGHYLADQIEDHLQTRSSPDLIFSDEREALLDSGGGVKKALSHLTDGPVLIANSDSFWKDRQGNAITQLAQAWNGEEMDILLLLTRHEDAVGFDGRGDFFVDGDGRLTRRGEALAASAIYAGLLVTSPAYVQQIADDAFSMNRLFDMAAADGRLFGTMLDGLWLHVGTPEAIAEAETALASFEGSRDAHE